MLRKITYLSVLLLSLMACRKNDPKTVVPEGVRIPADVLVFNIFDLNSGTTMKLLDASTGKLVTSYQYPAEPGVTWTYPVAGNGFVYNLDSKKISAIELSSGKVLWTDAVDNVITPVLHAGIFYGVDRVKGVYAMDATKATTVPLWHDQAISYAAALNYRNGLIYVSVDSKKLLVLDALTGGLKWERTFVADYRLTALDEGLIMVGSTLFDAVTGQELATAQPVAIPPSYTAQNSYTELQYATAGYWFIQTSHYEKSPGLFKIYLSAVDRVSGAEKWRIDYGGGHIGQSGVGAIVGSWNDLLLIRFNTYTSAGKYGGNYSENYALLDPETGGFKTNFAGVPNGFTVNSTLADHTMFFYKRFDPTLTFWYEYQKPANALFAIDMRTGKIKWDNSALLGESKTYIPFCAIIGGKAYSPFIQ